MKFQLVFHVLWAILFLPVRASAAEPSQSTAVKGNVRASFQITPLVQELIGRRGQRLPFRFQIQALDRPQSLSIRVVGLKQQLNGLVVVDEQSPTPEALNLSSPQELNLKPQQTATIQGDVDVPLSPASFHAYGILVTDLGQPFSSEQQPGQDQKQIGIRFVTRYLLRIEVDVSNGRPENAKELRIESARLVEHEGRPFVEADLLNPTESPVEFQLSCRIHQNNGKKNIPKFGLALPVRASRQEPQRYESLVFGQSRVRLTAPVPQPVFPGEYQIKLHWISHSRKGGEASFPVLVRKTDFPAQASFSVQVAEDLQITPSQIELSLGRGGNRRLPLTVTNNGTQPLQIHMTAQNLDGMPADWILVQPTEFLLAPGRNRNVLMAARAGSDVESHRYGVLQVQVGSRKTQLPVALIGRAEFQPKVEVGSLRWDPDGERPAFVLPIKNQGSVHLPLNARVTITGVLEQRLEIPGGFDRWLLPRRQDEIRFPLHHGLPSGTYEIGIQIQTAKNGDSRTIKQQVQIE